MVKLKEPPEGLGDRFSMESMINGIACDLQDLREGKISIQDARVRADLAKQFINGIRMIITARNSLEQNAKPVRQVGIAQD